jgi:hypothetical protein
LRSELEAATMNLMRYPATLSLLVAYLLLFPSMLAG